MKNISLVQAVLNSGHNLAPKTPFFFGWVVLAAAGSSQFSRNAAASLTLAIFMFPMSQDLGWSRTLIAGAASVGGLASSGASPIAGWLVDRYGSRIVLLVSVVLLGASIVSLAWATIPLTFFIAYGIARVLFSSSIPIGGTVVVSHWFIKRRGRAMGILFAAHSIGMTLFPLIAFLTIRYRNWQDAWIVLGVIVWVVAVIPVGALIVQSPKEVGLQSDGDLSIDSDNEADQISTSQESGKWTFRKAAQTRAFWLLAVSGGLVFMVQAGTNIHIGAYFRDQQLSSTIAATAIVLSAVFVGVGSLIWGWLVERYNIRYVLGSVALVLALASAALLMVSSSTEAFLASSLFGIAVGGMLVVPPVAAATYFGRRSLGTIRGVTESFVSLGQAIGAVFSGVVFEVTGSYAAAFLCFVVLGLLTVFLILFIKPPSQSVPVPTT